MYVTPDHHKKGKKPRDFRDRKLMFFDLEMTGSDPEKHEIIEIAWMIVDGSTFEVLSEYEAKVKPLHLETAEAEGLRVSQYSEKEWKNAKDLKYVLSRFAKVAPHAMLAGWAAFVDWQFLERGFEKYQIKPKFNYRILMVDSIAYTKLYDESKIKSVSLRGGGVLDYFKIKYPKEHGALIDVRLTYEAFKKLMIL